MSDVGVPPSRAQPLPALACPLCGGANHCAVAAAGRFDVACWCTRVAFRADVLARIEPAQRGRACICRACAEAEPAPPAEPPGRSLEP